MSKYVISDRKQCSRGPKNYFSGLLTRLGIIGSLGPRRKVIRHGRSVRMLPVIGIEVIEEILLPKGIITGSILTLLPCLMNLRQGSEGPVLPTLVLTFLKEIKLSNK